MNFRIFSTLAVALLGGGVFFQLNIPLPWILGPVASVILWGAFFGGKPHWPVGIRNAGLIALGYTMGRPFSLEPGWQ
jgi:uncharacterized membrane protein AbrB (regulator of aidB expression)